MTDKLQLQYGLQGVIPAEAKAAWGARLIVDQAGNVDLVPDRTDTAGPDEERLPFLARLTEVYSLAQLKLDLRKLLESGGMQTRTAERFTLHDLDGITVMADTNASCGYCYVSAWTVGTPTARDDYASIVGRMAGMGEKPKVSPVTVAQLIEAFCSGRDAAYSGSTGKSYRDDEHQANISKGFCGYNGRRDTEDALLTGFDDGYEFMGFLEDRGWTSVPNKGDWPYVVYLASQSRTETALVEYCEADLTVWQFDTTQARNRFYHTLREH